MKRKLLSVALCLMLALSMIPSGAMTVLAAGTVTCNTYAQFKAAMEDPAVSTVKLGSFIETVSQNSISAMTVRSDSGVKNLQIEGSANIWAANENKGYRYLIEVPTGVQLVVSGSGTLAGSPAYTDDHNALFYLNGGDLRFTKSFTGYATSDAKFDNTSGAVVHIKEGNLLSENGFFTVYNKCPQYGCENEHAVISTDVVKQSNTSVVLLGGYYGVIGHGYAVVVGGTAQSIFADQITYYANKIVSSTYVKSNNLITDGAEVVWNPYRMDREPNFVLADLGEDGEIQYELDFMSGNRFLNMDAVCSVDLYEHIPGNMKLVDSKSYANEERTFYLEASDTPTVKYYTMEVVYQYEFGGETIRFTAERELRAQWKDLTYNGAGTKEDPVKVSTFPELRRALQDKRITYVQVVSDIDCTLQYDAYRHDGSNSIYHRVLAYRMGWESAQSIYDYLSSVDVTDGFNGDADNIIGRSLVCTALEVTSAKHLILQGDVKLKTDSFPMSSDDTGFQYGIVVYNDLTISGGGTFAVDLTSAAMGPDAAAIRSNTGAELTIEDAKILANTRNGTGFAHAICVSDDGTLIIRDGEFRGQRSTENDIYRRGFYTGAVLVTDAYAQIDGGTFGELNFGEVGTDSIAGLMIEEEYLDQVTISGGYFETGVMKERNGYGYLLTQTEWDTVLDSGATYTTKTFSKNGVEITSATVTSPQKVRTVSLTVTEPKEGIRPDYMFGVDGTGYSVMGNTYNYTDYRQWQESDGTGNWRVMDTTDTFKAGYYYRAFVDIHTKNGYMFPRIYDGVKYVPDIIATVNGREAEVIKTYEQSELYYATLVINFGRCSERYIKQVELNGVTTPVGGQHPSYTGTVGGTGYILEPGESYDRWEGWLYKSNGMVWYDENWNILYEKDTFQTGKTYYLMVYLDISDTENYQFDWNDSLDYGTTNVKGFINGKEVEVQPEGSNTMWNHRLKATFVCAEPDVLPGDMDGDGNKDTDDAVYLLLHTMFGETDYPVANPDKDMNNDGKVDTDDAVYLLLHVMFGAEDYPI